MVSGGLFHWSYYGVTNGTARGWARPLRPAGRQFQLHVQWEAVTVAGTRDRGRRDGVTVAGPAGSWHLVEAELIGVSGFYDQASVLMCGVVHLCLSDSRDGPSSPLILDLSLASGAMIVICHLHFELQTVKTEDLVNSTQTTSDQILTP